MEKLIGFTIHSAKRKSCGEPPSVHQTEKLLIQIPKKAVLSPLKFRRPSRVDDRQMSKQQWDFSYIQKISQTFQPYICLKALHFFLIFHIVTSHQSGFPTDGLNSANFLLMPLALSVCLLFIVSSTTKQTVKGGKL